MADELCEETVIGEVVVALVLRRDDRNIYVFCSRFGSLRASSLPTREQRRDEAQ
jgi:hypothetical protein